MLCCALYHTETPDVSCDLYAGLDTVTLVTLFFLSTVALGFIKLIHAARVKMLTKIIFLL